MAVKVMCPVCKSEFMTSDGAFATPVTAEQNGVAYLVPKVVGKAPNKKDDRLKALEDAGINLNKLQTLMQSNSDLKDIFESDDPVIAELGKGGFINNPELFRRWICAQSFRLLKDPKGWTHAVRKTYDIKYVCNQSKRELRLLCKLIKKCPNDIRLRFFTLDDLKSIFYELMDFNDRYRYFTDGTKDNLKVSINNCRTYESLLNTVESIRWRFDRDYGFKPKAWLNCFKGAGAYYTLQNIIRTHDLVLPDCKDMDESLKVVDEIFEAITAYKPNERRWDIMLSLLTRAVDVRKFELKY